MKGPFQPRESLPCNSAAQFNLILCKETHLDSGNFAEPFADGEEQHQNTQSAKGDAGEVCDHIAQYSRFGVPRPEAPRSRGADME